MTEGKGAVVGVSPTAPLSFGTPLTTPLVAWTHTVAATVPLVVPFVLLENTESVMTRVGVTSL